MEPPPPSSSLASNLLNATASAILAAVTLSVSSQKRGFQSEAEAGAEMMTLIKTRDAARDDRSPIVLAHLEPRAFLKRFKNADTSQDFALLLSNDPFDVVQAVVVGSCLLFLAHKVLTRVSARGGVPEVLLFLFAGMLLRLCSGEVEAAKFDLIAKPLVRMALTAMGLQIGSHLNRAVLLPLMRPLVRFTLVFVPTVLCICSGMAALLFPPHLASFSWLVGSIALERSSPEALHGIAAAKAAGPFANQTMAIAALQDIYALVSFVVFSALVGSPLLQAMAHLLELSVGTAVATALTVVCIRAAVAIPSVNALFVGGGGGANGSGGNNGTTNNAEEAPAVRSRRVFYLRLLLLLLVFVTPLLSWFMHVELLLAAVVAGSILNWDAAHKLTAALESHSMVSNIVLFCLLGHRISILSYLQNLPFAVILFLTRLFALWLGAMGGGYFGPLTAVAAPLTSTSNNALSINTTGPNLTPTAMLMGSGISGGLVQARGRGRSDSIGGTAAAGVISSVLGSSSPPTTSRQLHQQPQQQHGGGESLSPLLTDSTQEFVGSLDDGASGGTLSPPPPPLSVAVPPLASINATHNSHMVNAGVTNPTPTTHHNNDNDKGNPAPISSGNAIINNNATTLTATNNRLRWMGLVTQLAIALSLVDRMEEAFPASAPMARACGGSVVGALLVGPSLLQYVLRRVGEAGKATTGSGGH